MIIEDDVRFCEGFSDKLESLLQSAPKFDMLFLNGTIGKFNKPTVEHGLLRVREMYGAFGYIVDKRFYNTAIKALAEYAESMGTDYIYTRLMFEHTIYRVQTPLIFHLPGYSYRAENIPKGYKHLEK